MSVPEDSGGEGGLNDQQGSFKYTEVGQTGQALANGFQTAEALSSCQNNVLLVERSAAELTRVSPSVSSLSYYL